MVKIEFDTNSISIENILPIVYDTFELHGIDFDIRKIKTDIEFILIDDLTDIKRLFEQIKFINILFKKSSIITLRLSNVHKLHYNTLAKFSNNNISYIDYIIDDLEELSNYDIYRMKVNYLDLQEYDIDVNIYSPTIVKKIVDISNNIISNSIENIRKGTYIERVDYEY